MVSCDGARRKHHPRRDEPVPRSNIGDAVNTAVAAGASASRSSFGSQEYSGENSASKTVSSGITLATEVGNTVTITTSSTIVFASGCQVAIVGVGVAGYNGTFTINSVTSTSPGNTFTYTDPNAGLASSNGGSAAVAAEDNGIFSGHSAVAFVGSSGDTGQPPQYPSVPPGLLAVGAATLNLNGDNTYNAEIGWCNPPAITNATESGGTVTITAATATGLFRGRLHHDFRGHPGRLQRRVHRHKGCRAEHSLPVHGSHHGAGRLQWRNGLWILLHQRKLGRQRRRQEQPGHWE